MTCSFDRYFLPAGPAAANPPQRRANDGTDRRTDGMSLIDHSASDDLFSRELLVSCCDISTYSGLRSLGSRVVSVLDSAAEGPG